jgi:hypothetical protein
VLELPPLWPDRIMCLVYKKDSYTLSLPGLTGPRCEVSPPYSSLPRYVEGRESTPTDARDGEGVWVCLFEGLSLALVEREGVRRDLETRFCLIGRMA